MGKFGVRDLYITTTDAEKPSAPWSNPRGSWVVQHHGLPCRWVLKWRVTLRSLSNRISWNAKDEKYRYRSSCKIYFKK
jgi:hypothetical protein